MIQVIDNFLSPDSHKKISNFLLTAGLCEWKYNDRKVSNVKNNTLNDYQFTHNFFTFHSLTGARHVVSKQIDVLIPLVNKIRFISLHRIKANLEPIKPSRYVSKFHYDLEKDGRPCDFMTTGIYYINTNDGYTEFETGEKVESVANRYVKFPSNIKHRGVSQLDTKVRCVLNLNYFEFPT
tara:strand:+ start:1240 stop:1779 length:540 start_codon:yes stop_codon:yes gene_type:complete